MTERKYERKIRMLNNGLVLEVTYEGKLDKEDAEMIGKARRFDSFVMKTKYGIQVPAERTKTPPIESIEEFTTQVRFCLGEKTNFNILRKIQSRADYVLPRLLIDLKNYSHDLQEPAIQLVTRARNDITNVIGGNC